MNTITEKNEKPLGEGLMDTMHVPVWLRWILILPLAIFMYALVDVVFVWIIKHFFNSWLSWNSESAIKIADILPACAGAFVYIYSGYSSAPKYRNPTALILLLLLVLLMLSLSMEEIRVIGIIPQHTCIDLIKYILVTISGVISYIVIMDKK